MCSNELNLQRKYTILGPDVAGGIGNENQDNCAALFPSSRIAVAIRFTFLASLGI